MRTFYIEHDNRIITNHWGKWDSYNAISVWRKKASSHLHFVLIIQLDGSRCYGQVFNFTSVHEYRLLLHFVSTLCSCISIVWFWIPTFYERVMAYFSYQTGKQPPKLTSQNMVVLKNAHPPLIFPLIHKQPFTTLNLTLGLKSNKKNNKDK